MFKKLISYVLLFMVVVSCNKPNAPDCFKTSGSEVTEVRDVAPFHIIALYDNMEVKVVRGSDYKVEVTAGENMLKKIKTRLDGDILNIENNNRCNFVRGYDHKILITITMPYLLRFENYGVGDATITDNFTQDTLQLKAESSGDIYVDGTFDEIRTSSHGNGDMYLSGTCNRLYVYMNGTNFLWAQDLNVTNFAFVDERSIGDCYLNLTHATRFEYILWSDGNVYYTGHPPQIVKNPDGTGKGEAIHMD